MVKVLLGATSESVTLCARSTIQIPFPVMTSSPELSPPTAFRPNELTPIHEGLFLRQIYSDRAEQKRGVRVLADSAFSVSPATSQQQDFFGRLYAQN
jgi:hypothetical protein